MEAFDHSLNSADVTHLDQKRKRVTGRVISLSHVNEGILQWLAKTGDNRRSTGGIVSISFPSMPETIDLARSSEYRVAQVYMAPDGVHSYISTKPLEIPISFQLSIHDREYAQHGALTLLATAAKLHSLVLPVSTDGTTHVASAIVAGAISKETQDGKSTAAPPSAGFVQGATNFLTDLLPGVSVARNLGLSMAGTSPAITEARTANQSTASEPAWEQTSTNERVSGNESTTYPPVAVLLDLISDGRERNVSLGVSCIGYINMVRTRFKGPWLQPSNGGKNMPSVLECDLTFVHFPGYTNRFAQTGTYDQKLMNAYAEEVRSNFYNLAEKSAAFSLNADRGTNSDDSSSYRGLSW